MDTSSVPVRPGRWSPLWAVICAWVSLLVPAVVLLAGLRELSYGLSGAYMSELSQAIAPLVLAVGLFLLIAPVAYLIWRTKLLFITAMVVTVGALLVPVLSFLF